MTSFAIAWIIIALLVIVLVFIIGKSKDLD